MCDGQSSELTIISSHEGHVVLVVLDVRRLSVKGGDGGNPAIIWVNLQPAGRVEHLGVPGSRKRQKEVEREREKQKDP